MPERAGLPAPYSYAAITLPLGSLTCTSTEPAEPTIWTVRPRQYGSPTVRTPGMG